MAKVQLSETPFLGIKFNIEKRSSPDESSDGKESCSDKIRKSEEELLKLRLPRKCKIMSAGRGRWTFRSVDREEDIRSEIKGHCHGSCQLFTA
ncbi:hypothetical protein RUM43_012653 [Polyplax serrata]|uniref:Uncharacterized protein n=1 Tax=Polyplax serrata TaxID=468196 RepID=A0AAN8RZ00_POLSC